MFYAQYRRYGLDTRSMGDDLFRFTRRVDRDSFVNKHANALSLTREYAQQIYPKAFGEFGNELWRGSQDFFCDMYTGTPAHWWYE